MSLETAMFDLSEDIQSLSHFKRNTSELLSRIKRSGHPLVLTINGKAELVVQDATAYQRLRELAQQVDDMLFLYKSKADIGAGRTRDARRAIKSLGKRR
jgi:prevent-host-death family protein